MVALSRRKRMVAHNIADVSLLFAVMVRRRTVLSRGSFDRVFRDVIVRSAIRQNAGWSHAS